MSGLELHRSLIDSGHAIPTILVTAYPNDAERDRAMSELDEAILQSCLHKILGTEKP